MGPGLDGDGINPVGVSPRIKIGRRITADALAGPSLDSPSFRPGG